MATDNRRKFADVEAVREETPLLIGLMGPSGSGKTYSALRLATGIQSVVGGDIYAIDTEANRAKHYAGRFGFRHVPFGAPFSPLDYRDAILHCVDRGAKTIIVDSMSHEHEGEGGVLDWHAAEIERLTRGDASKADRVQMLAWKEPKQARQRLIQTILQINANFIFCFRAKEKIKPQRGGQPLDMGWMPIAGENFIYEMTLNALLLPGSKGVATWNPEEPGSRAMVKLPEQFEWLSKQRVPFSEDIGAKLAEWARGAPARPQSNPLEGFSKAIQVFSQKGVTEKMIRDLLGMGTAVPTEDHVSRLRNLARDLASGSVTLDDVFPSLADQRPREATQAPPVRTRTRTPAPAPEPEPVTVPPDEDDGDADGWVDPDTGEVQG